MQRDPGDRTGRGLPPDVAEADVLEQSLPVGRDVDASDAGDADEDPLPVDANPDDVFEQRLEVPFEDDDYPPG
jgi:hypothetical protein